MDTKLNMGYCFFVCECVRLKACELECVCVPLCIGGGGGWTKDIVHKITKTESFLKCTHVSDVPAMPTKYM